MAEIRRKRSTHSSRKSVIVPRGSAQFHSKPHTLVSETKKGMMGGAKSIVHGIKQAVGKVATKEEIRHVNKAIHKVAGSKEVKAVGGFLNRWASLYDETLEEQQATRTQSKKKHVITTKRAPKTKTVLASCGCRAVKKR